MTKKEQDELRRKILADNIGRFRYQAGFSQQQFANMLGISKTRLQRYEWNQSQPRMPLVYRMAERLRIDIRQLLMSEEEWKSLNNDALKTSRVMETRK